MSTKINRLRNSKKNEYGWGRIKTAVADVWRFPVENPTKLPAKIKNQSRQTQILATDLPFQIWRIEQGSCLVKLMDETFGWLPKSLIKNVPAKNYWVNLDRAKLGKTKPTAKFPADKINLWLKKLANKNYLWGGRSEAGLDCSAFTQTIFWQAAKILLPRNSRQQKRCGQRIKKSELQPLDLVFFEHRKKRLSHVGLVWNGQINHFCLDSNGLKKESLGDMNKRYRYLSARRILNQLSS